METNTIENNTNTTIITTTLVKASGKKLGRKPTSITEILDKEFTITELVKVNPSVVTPTVRAFITRNVEAGRYILVRTQKNGGRGKPSNVYQAKV